MAVAAPVVVAVVPHVVPPSEERLSQREERVLALPSDLKHVLQPRPTPSSPAMVAAAPHQMSESGEYEYEEEWEEEEDSDAAGDGVKPSSARPFVLPPAVVATPAPAPPPTVLVLSARPEQAPPVATPVATLPAVAPVVAVAPPKSKGDESVDDSFVPDPSWVQTQCKCGQRLKASAWCGGCVSCSDGESVGALGALPALRALHVRRGDHGRDVDAVPAMRPALASLCAWAARRAARR